MTTTTRNKPARKGSRGTATPEPQPLPLGQLLLAAFLALVASLVHVTVLTGPGVRLSQTGFYLLVAVPALLHLALWPAPTLRRGYRWLIVWALMLTSLLPQVVLLLGQGWVMWRAYIDRTHGTDSVARWVSDLITRWTRRRS